MATDYQAQLDEVNAAITAVLTRGQSYKIGDREFTRVNMEHLVKMRADLESKVNSTKRSGLKFRRAVVE